MQIEKLENNWYLIRIEPGEPFMSSLAKVMRDGKFGFAWFWSIGGGFKGVDCSFSVGHKIGSIPKNFEGPMELSNANGNITWDDEKSDNPIVHCHVDLADEELKGYGAHLVEAKVVELTAEILLKTFEKKITRQLDERVNLKLLDLLSYSKPTQQEFSQSNSPNNFPIGLAFPLGIIILGLLGLIMFWATQKSKKIKI